MRWVIGALGIGLLGWGAVLLVPVAFDSPLTLGGWLVGGPILHDAVLAPLVGVAGVLIARVLPKPWRAPVGAGLVVSGLLVVLAVPYLWRAYSGPVTPGLHDRPYPAGLLIALAVVWVVVAVAGLVSGRRRENTPAAP
ncbi:MAG: hypothetical protein ABWY11_23505 [Umezawaea sp.]